MDEIMLRNWLRLLSLPFAVLIVSGLMYLVSTEIEKRKNSFLYLGARKYRHASLFRRFVACAIDSSVFFFCLIVLLKILNSRMFGEISLHYYLFALSGVGFFSAVLNLMYLTVFEAKWGMTIGKWLCVIKVVNERGVSCGITKAATRNICRVVDGLFGYLVGVIFFAGSGDHQRIGDYFAKTYVVVNDEGLSATHDD